MASRAGFLRAVFRQPLVQNGEVRVDEAGDAKVPVDQFAKEPLRFANHRFDQQIIKLIIRIKLSVWSCALDQAQVEPIIEEVIDEPPRARIVEQTLSLLSQDSWAMQFAAIG